MKAVRYFIFLLVLAAPFSFTFARECSAPNLEIIDQTYRWLDKLKAHGLIQSAIIGQRPLSRNEIARQISEAQDRWKKLGRENLYIESVLERLAQNFREDIDCRKSLPQDSPWRLYDLNVFSDIVFGKSPSRAILRDSGATQVLEADTNPLLDGNQGRHLVDGFNFASESKASIGLTPILSFHFHPRAQLQSPWNTSGEQEVFLQEGYAKIVWYNISLLLGRAERQSGQLQNGGAILSNNPRPLDQAFLSNDVPFRAWILGPARFSFIYADLGPEQRFSHPYLAGWKMSFLPWPVFEWGISMMAIGGGEGSPNVGIANRALDLFGLGENGNLAGSNVPASNRLAQVDFRLRIPSWRGMEMYLDALIEDAYALGELGAQFNDNMGYSGGIYLPRLDTSGKMDLRLEYKQFQHRVFRHHIFTDGWAINRRLLGDPLGPQSNGFYADLNYDLNLEWFFHLGAAFERRDGDSFATTNQTPLTFAKSVDNPSEDRFQWTFGLIWDQGVFILENRLGMEVVTDFNHVAGNDRQNIVWLSRFTIPLAIPRNQKGEIK